MPDQTAAQPPPAGEPVPASVELAETRAALAEWTLDHHAQKTRATRAEQQLDSLRHAVERVLDDAAKAYRLRYDAARGAAAGTAADDGANYWHWVGQAEAIRETANDLATRAGLPAPSWGHAGAPTGIAGGTEPTIVRQCAYPDCMRHYDAARGPQEPGWLRLRGLTVLCPDHRPPDIAPADTTHLPYLPADTAARRPLAAAVRGQQYEAFGEPAAHLQAVFYRPGVDPYPRGQEGHVPAGLFAGGPPGFQNLLLPGRGVTMYRTGVRTIGITKICGQEYAIELPAEVPEALRENQPNLEQALHAQWEARTRALTPQGSPNGGDGQ